MEPATVGKSFDVTTLSDHGTESQDEADETAIANNEYDQDSVIDIDTGGSTSLGFRSGGFWTNETDFRSSHGYSLQHSAAQRWDFVALVSTISQVYRRGIYLDMIKLDDETWQDLGHGTTFTVSRSQVKLQTSSARNPRIKDLIATRLVLKRNDYHGKMSADQVCSFIKEVRVLDHMQGHPFVIKLRAIGWFNEYYTDLDRCSKPGIVLEEAFDTLDYLVGPDVSLSYRDMLRIFGQVTAALCAIHHAGIAHGDLKPGNILLFKTMENRDGLQSESYIAKLSDFGSAIFKDETKPRYAPGTVGYTAPEATAQDISEVSFEEILLADTWSLGILFAVVLLSSREILEGPSRSRNVKVRIRRIVSKVTQHLESKAADAFETDTISQLMNNTLMEKASDRDLGRVAAALTHFMGADAPHIASDTERLRMMPERDLFISYENLKHLSGQFKEDLVDGLKRVAASNEPRATKASWELGVIYLTNFADPDSSVDEGLRYIRAAAEGGDIRAKALCFRLHKAFGSSALDKVSDRQRLQWLTEAAESGHHSAISDLHTVDPDQAIRAQAVVASHFYGFCSDEDLDPNDQRISSNEIERESFPLHEAAATGQVDDLASLLDENDSHLDVTNSDGDTPLVASCRFGQPNTVRLLMSKGANASIRNKFGENALHYIWRFYTNDAESITRDLLAKGADPDAISTRAVAADEFDLFPILPGTPLERVAGRGRLDLCLILMESGNALKPCNGRLGRSILIWATRLHHFAIQDLLLDTMQSDHPSFDENLPPVKKSAWRYRGQQRNILDAACVGWTSGDGTACDVPTRFWLACRHDYSWKKAVYEATSRTLRALWDIPEGRESFIDKSLEWARQESLYDAVIALLRLKFEMAPGIKSRSFDIDVLRWNLQMNPNVIQPHEIYLIDQLFHTKDITTLAQQALLVGNRQMFRLLTSLYHANARLPIPSNDPCLYNVPLLLGEQVNLYTALVYTAHRDIWFAEELQRLGVPFSTPWDDHPYQKSMERFEEHNATLVYFPPLLHAIKSHWWAFALYLLRNGASLEEKIIAHFTVLGATMASRSEEQMSFIFRGINDKTRGSQFLSQVYHQDGGYPVLCLFFQTASLRKLLGWTSAESDNENDGYRYLLETYPLADDLPSLVASDVLLGSHHSLSRQAVRQDVESLIALFKARPATSERTKQKLIHYFLDSPADALSARDLAAILNSRPEVTLRHFSPSLLWLGITELWYAPIISTIAVLVFRWILGGDPSYWASDDWFFGFWPKLVTGLFVLIASVGSIGTTVWEVIFSANKIEYLFVHIKECLLVGVPLVFFLVLPVLVHLCMVVILMFLVISAKGQSGYFWIPYVF